jgi:hypothetical protein
MRYHLLHRLVAATSIVAAALMMSACATTAAFMQDAPLEEIYLLRSIREQRQSIVADGCAAAKSGFDPYADDAERWFSFWSVVTRTVDGKAIDVKHTRVGQLRACFGPTQDRTRQNFYAEIRLGAIDFRGRGECVALMIDFPQPGLFPVRCHLILSDLPPSFIGGLLTTNTMTSGARFGGESQPSGYTQASIATLRLWKDITALMNESDD